MVDFGDALAGRPIVAIAAGAGHSLARTSDGMMFAWGNNQFVQLNVPGVNSNHLRPTVMEAGGALNGLLVTDVTSGPSAYSTMFVTMQAAKTDITVSATGAQFRVFGEPFANYRLERATSLTPPVSWVPLAPLTTDVLGSATYTDTLPASSAFWRTVPAP